ncbi:glycoside hydrolase family 88 protein [Paenibacillus glycanilyticus]|uniref:Glycosyl hydrolase n=1 Tax=Paenibacillus glycanilyticus TaxID=126569 RepID=A0ABQ6G9Z3_9BACL|nr:glycoside hydrolase family 88 protein [Paenibacillus glycanilyticus]GLX67786.1 glycosyl hydrolase [Paenibacillus glycanilyticus]
MEQKRLREIQAFILEKTRQNANRFGDKLPHATVNGQYDFMDNGFWVGGFWTGLLWLAFEATGDAAWAEAARRSRNRFTKRLYEERETTDHDLGFLFSLSSVADYRLTGDQAARQHALDAAEALAERFNPPGNYIQAWNVWTPGDPFSEENRGRIIIDCMYNLPLLFWASEETGDDKYREIAIAQADTCAKTIVRPDRTTFHTYLFDPESGEPLRGKTHQGYADDSCWSRGQTWAIGGYAHAYRYTRKPEYMQLAKELAQVYIDRLEDDLVPMWDFAFAGGQEGEPRDTSAGAIAAASFLEMASLLPEEEGAYYRRLAERIVESLYENYSTKDEPKQEGLLKEATGHKPADSNINVSLIYGDYYFAEAVARLLGETEVYW